MAHDHWTRDQQLLALRLYVRSAFGRLHGRNPDIVRQAEGIGRTANALAMKACNFASLDPAFRATNRRGLSGASTADRALWAEFVANPDAIADEAEATYEAFMAGEPKAAAAEIAVPSGETDALRLVRTRRVQSFFRAAVLTSYDGTCAVSGMRLRALLNASHIIPWSHAHNRRADPTNGICLNALFDRAFDRGLMTIDEDMRVVMSPVIRSAATNAALACSLLEAEGRKLTMPSRFLPDPAALEYHRQAIYRCA